MGDEFTSSPGLTCTEYDTGVEDDSHAVLYSCRGYAPGVEIPDGEGFSQVFNQRCFSDVGLQTFDCYQLGPDTDYSSFFSQVESSDLPDCEYSEEEVAAGSPVSPSFLYQVVLEEEKGAGAGPVFGDTTFTGPDPTASFDSDLALLAMHASVKEKPPGSPTAAASTNDPAQAPTLPLAGVDTSSSGSRSFLAALTASTWFLAMMLN